MNRVARGRRYGERAEDDNARTERRRRRISDSRVVENLITVLTRAVDHFSFGQSRFGNCDFTLCVAVGQSNVANLQFDENRPEGPRAFA